jgi:hypothetical protein
VSLKTLDHRLRKIECHGSNLWMDQANECQQATVATPEIQDVGQRRGKTFEERLLTFRPVRDGVGLREIGESMFW